MTTQKIRPLLFCALLVGTIHAANEKEQKKTVLALESDEVDTNLGITNVGGSTEAPEIEAENTLETFAHKFQSGFTLLTIQVRNHWDAKTAAIGGFALSTVLFCALYLNSHRNARALQELGVLKVQLANVQNENADLQNEKNVLIGALTTERTAREKLAIELVQAKDEVVRVKRLLEEEKTRSNVQRAKAQSLETQISTHIEQSVKAETEKRKELEQCMKNVISIADELDALAIPLGPAPVDDVEDEVIYSDDGAAIKVADLVRKLRVEAQKLQQPPQEPKGWATTLWFATKRVVSLGYQK